MTPSKYDYSLASISEECANRNLKLLTDVPVANSRTKLCLECNNCGFVWNSTIVQSFLRSSKRGCPICNNKKDDEFHIQAILATGKFLEGSKFKRLDQKESPVGNSFWEMSCPLCSNDEYVKNNLCTGKFVSSTWNLKRGQLPCRCAKNYRWSSEQNNLRLSMYLTNNNRKWSFKRLSGNFVSSRYSVFEFTCELGHVWETFLDAVVLRDSGCQICTKTGFNIGKQGVIYVLRVAGEKEFTGFGISNNFTSRLRKHKQTLRNANSLIDELEVFEMDGLSAYNIEKLLKVNFEIINQGLDGFKTEATHYHLYDDVLKFIEIELAKYVKLR